MERKTCPTCGGPMEADTPQGLCPACLLNEGLRTNPTEGPSAASGFRADAVRTALEAKLRGQYRVIRLLGQGGMGAVYLARDLTLDREVAIKVMKSGGDADVYDRLRREAKTAARLSHPNIVPLHAFGEVEGMPYFVMGFVRGESLANRLRRDGRLAEEDVARIVAEIADALDHAHRQGIVHRDVKPDNVLVDDETGRALLTDFGVAKAVDPRDPGKTAGHVVGTPQYMSPEQASGHAVDGRSDIYSLGVMAYAMLTGRLPFEGKTAQEVLTKHLMQEAPPLRSLVPVLSDAMVQAVERCLVKDPARRWPDARSLRQLLGDVDRAGAPMPEALRHVESQGFWLGSWAFVAAILVEWAWLWRGDIGVGAATVLGMSGTVVAIAVIGAVRRAFAAHAQGIPWAHVLQVAFLPPANWALWYPRRLRRPDDVWDRLPVSARFIRILPATWLGFGLALGPMALLVLSPAYDTRTDATDRMLSILVYRIITPLSHGSFLALLVAPVVAMRRLRRKGLSRPDGLRLLLTEPTAQPDFWVRPDIAPLLAPAPKADVGPRSDAPNDQLQSILRDAEELSGPLRPLGAEAAAAARQLLTVIESADHEIARLMRNVEPGEEERLADKIAVLAPGNGGSDENGPMRRLLEKQLELIRGLQGRIDHAREERTRRAEMLKMLALHVVSLRARSAEATSEVRPISERVRAICDDISRQAMAGEPASRVDENATLERTKRA